MIDINQVQRDFDNGVMLCRETIRQVIELAAGNAAVEKDNVTYGWLVRASNCGLPDVESSAQILKHYYEGADGPAVPRRAPDQSPSLSELIENLGSTLAAANEMERMKSAPDNSFRDHLQKCSEEVATWPEWKKRAHPPISKDSSCG